MTSRRFNQLLEQLFDGNRTRFAELIEYDVRQVRRMASGECPVPLVIAILLEAMAAGRVNPKTVRSLVA